MQTERQRMPYIQIDANLWAVMRNQADHPAAMILGIRAEDGEARFLVLSWHPIPSRRRLISIHPTLEDANRSVRWEVPNLDGDRFKHPNPQGFMPGGGTRKAPSHPPGKG